MVKSGGPVEGAAVAPKREEDEDVTFAAAPNVKGEEACGNAVLGVAGEAG